MKQFRVSSRDGSINEIIPAVNKVEALASLHQLAGYDVKVKSGKIVWPDEDTRIICGEVEDWFISEI